MSLAHQYAIYLMEHDWKPLEDHSPEVSQKTWLMDERAILSREATMAEPKMASMPSEAIGKANLAQPCENQDYPVHIHYAPLASCAP